MRCWSAASEAPDFDEFWEAGELVLPTLPWDGGIVRAFRRDPDGGALADAERQDRDRVREDCGVRLRGLPRTSDLAAARGGARMRVSRCSSIANQPATRLHSQLDFGATSLESKIKDREPVRIHPQDAAARGIRDGDIVRLYNDRGACLAGAVLSEALRPGVVQLSTGAWYDPEDPAADNPICVHGNPNVLTRDAGTSKLAQGCTGQLTVIEIERFDGPLPPVKAFDPPSGLS